eukprot:jgi/Orpsp1_1/1174314/evm.model.c7180000049650.1
MIIYIYIFIISFLSNIQAKEFYIYNDYFDLISIEDIIKNNQNDDITIYFPTSTVNIIISSNVIFQSKNKKAVFNFKNKENKGFQIQFKNNGSLKFYNISFKNFVTYSEDIYLIKSFYNEPNINYYLEFENCDIENISSNFYISVSMCSKVTQTTPYTLFNNCNFKNIKYKILHSYNGISDDSIEEMSLCNQINFLNCNFNDSNNLFTINNACVDINNCNFNNISSNDNNFASIIESKTRFNNISIINSNFENNNINFNVPLMHFIENEILIKNVKFSKCYTNYGYLIKVDKSIDKYKFIVDDCIFD